MLRPHNLEPWKPFNEPQRPLIFFGSVINEHDFHLISELWFKDGEKLFCIIRSVVEWDDD